jgi:hypothetical protein
MTPIYTAIWRCQGHIVKIMIEYRYGQTRVLPDSAETHSARWCLRIRLTSGKPTPACAAKSGQAEIASETCFKTCGAVPMPNRSATASRSYRVISVNFPLTAIRCWLVHSPWGLWVCYVVRRGKLPVLPLTQDKGDIFSMIIAVGLHHIERHPPGGR